jgi:hypothetical protein
MNELILEEPVYSLFRSRLNPDCEMMGEWFEFGGVRFILKSKRPPVELLEVRMPIRALKVVKELAWECAGLPSNPFSSTLMYNAVIVDGIKFILEDEEPKHCNPFGGPFANMGDIFNPNPDEDEKCKTCGGSNWIENKSPYMSYLGKLENGILVEPCPDCKKEVRP